MKKFTYALAIGLLLMCPLFLRAQSNQTVGGTYSSKLSYALSPLNKNVLQTRTLYDYVVPVANLYQYDGTGNTLASNSDHFHQAIWELNNATNSTFGNAAGQNIIDPNQLVQSLQSNYGRYNHPLTILCHDYEFIDSSAIRDNKVSASNGQLFDVAGRSGSPYVKRQAVLVTPLLQPEQPMVEGTHTISIDTRYMFGNAVGQVKALQINFDDGQGWRYVDLSGYAETRRAATQWSIAYGVGVKNIQTQLTYSNNQTVTAKATIVVGRDPMRYINACSGTDQIAITGFPYNTSEYDGNVSTKTANGRAYIFYSDANCQSKRITKPIIFIDGFDPTNSRGAAEIYDDYINKAFPDGNQTGQLAQELRNQGYDIIIYDYEQGGDFIEGNALSVAKLLQELYVRYGSTMQSDFVIIGPSMGSLVARYCLAWMETNNIAHHTRLYCSFDGIHKGANVPLGVQHVLDFFSEVRVLSDGFNNNFHKSPAARQMIINHSDASDPTPGPSRYRTVFLQHLQQIGNYPKLCRNIAVVNGSKEGGLNPNITPCGELFNFTIKRTGLGALFCGGLNCNLIQWLANASPESGRCLTAQLWTNPLTVFPLSIPKLAQYYDNASANGVSYDRAQGSYLGNEETLNNAVYSRTFKTVLAILFPFRPYEINYSSLVKATFVPSISAADFTPSNDPSVRLASYTLNKCAGTTPFDQVYVSSTATDHVQITAEIANFFRTEVYNSLTTTCQPACNFAVSASPSDGNTNRSCGAGVTLNATCSGANCDNVSYNWTGNGLNQSGSSASFNAPSTNGTYTYTLTASRPGCSDKTTTVNITVSGCGGGNPTTSCTDYSPLCSGNSQEIASFQLNVATPGNYALTISYRSHEKPVDAIVRVNGVSQTVHFDQTSINTYTTVTTAPFSFNANNTVGISSGTNGGYICVNRLCAGGGGTNDPCDFAVSASPSDGNTNRSCGAGVTLNATCSGANCDNVSYNWTGNGLNQSGNSVNFNLPNSNGTYTYTVTANRPNCQPKTASVTLTVSGCGGNPTASCTDYSPQCSGNSQEIASFQLNVATPGSYALTISYRSHEKPVDAIVRVNGVSQTVHFNQTDINTYTTVTTAPFSFNTNNTVGISSGTNGGYICVNRLCAGEGTSQPVDPSSNPADGSYEGYHDALDCNNTYGWVWNSSYPNQAISIEVLDGGAVIATTTANVYRSDLQQAGKGNGQHGFSVTLPGSVRNGQSHSLSIRVVGRGFVLANSPRTITCAAGGRLSTGLPENLTESLEGLSVWPNPASGTIQVQFGAQPGEAGTIELTDLLGRSLQSQPFQATEGVYTQKLTLPSSASGRVLLRITKASGQLSKSIIIKK